MRCVRLHAAVGYRSRRWLDVAAGMNKVAVVRFMLESGITPSLDTVTTALQRGHLETVRVFMDAYPEEMKRLYACNDAIPCLEAVELLWQQGHQLKAGSFVRQALFKGSRACLRWGLEHGCRWSAEDVSFCGNVETLELMLRWGAPIAEWPLWFYLGEPNSGGLVAWALRHGRRADPAAATLAVASSPNLPVERAVLVLLAAGTEAEAVKNPEVAQAVRDARLVSAITADIFSRVLYKAAAAIQQAWRVCVSNPAYAACRRRLAREFAALQD